MLTPHPDLKSTLHVVPTEVPGEYLEATLQIMTGRGEVILRCPMGPARYTRLREASLHRPVEWIGTAMDDRYYWELRGRMYSTSEFRLSTETISALINNLGKTRGGQAAA
jgi:hypothetical protein